MLNDWTQWLCSLRLSELLLIIAPILLMDASRYLLGSVSVFVADLTGDVVRWLRGESEPEAFQHCPSVCAVIAGLNEGATLYRTLETTYGTYPHLEIVVVDDGSTDDMAQVAHEFAQAHPGVTVIKKPQRGGKSSALNCALPYTQADVIICIDADSLLAENAIWEIVQPFQDPTVGAVSGAVMGRSPFKNLATWMQGLEYLRCIFIGRMFTSRTGILSIVSGAFGAFRRDAIQRAGGWDVGPGEDGDLVLRLRKAGYRVVFTPYAQCLTDLLDDWWRLIKQRRRWEWAVVTFECRKHVDMVYIFDRHFRLSNLIMAVDRFAYGVLFQYVFVAYQIWLFFHMQQHLFYHLVLYYLAYTLMEVVQVGVMLYYSNERKRDLLISLIFPLMPFYYVLMRFVTLFAITEELLTRRSFRDNFVPKHVREATWHW